MANVLCADRSSFFAGAECESCVLVRGRERTCEARPVEAWEEEIIHHV